MDAGKMGMSLLKNSSFILVLSILFHSHGTRETALVLNKGRTRFGREILFVDKG
jgi:hypothetical protein